MACRLIYRPRFRLNKEIIFNPSHELGLMRYELMCDLCDWLCVAQCYDSIIMYRLVCMQRMKRGYEVCHLKYSPSFIYLWCI